MVGVPGSGISLAAMRLPSTLPPLSEAEALEVAHVASCTGRPLRSVPERPFRAPHHTIGPAGLAGGCQPGEVTLAHCGVLYLDDIAEFRRDSLEALEAVLEGGEALAARRLRSFPARVMLVGSGRRAAAACLPHARRPRRRRRGWAPPPRGGIGPDLPLKGDGRKAPAGRLALEPGAASPCARGALPAQRGAGRTDRRRR